MRILIDKFVLSAGLGEGVSGYREQIAPTIQMAMPLRSTGAKFFDRGNEKTTISFNITRIHASIGASETFVQRHGREVPKRGLVTLISEDGTKQTKTYLENACVSTSDGSYTGCTTFHSYQITGGEILLAKPT